MDMYEIFVPTIRNNGKPFRTKHHKNWDKRVIKITGGLSVFTPIKGQWANGGQIFNERMIPVRVACNRKQILKIIDITMEHYNQKAVMAYKVSEDVIIRYNNLYKEEK